MEIVSKKYLLKFVGVLCLFLFAFIPGGSVSAFQSGGTASMTLLPASGTMTIGQEYAVDVLFNTKNVPVSSIQFRILIPVVSGDIEVVRTAYNTGLSGCTSPFAVSAKIVGDVIQVDGAIVCLDVAGYAVNTNTKLATITVKATKYFSNKSIQFDQTKSNIYKKDGALDILGSTTNASFLTSGSAPVVTLTPAASPSPSPVPSANPTSPTGGTSTQPTTCDSSCDLAHGCGGGFTCVYITGVYRCRNTSCPGVANCSCSKIPTPTTKKTGTTYIIATRTPAPTSTTAPIAMISDAIPTPMPTLAPIEPTLTVDSFYDASRNAKSTFMVSGMSDPNAKILLEISPDIFIKTTTADTIGAWSIQVSSGVKSGKKSMTVTATNANGEKIEKIVTFAVTGGTSFANSMIVFVAFGVIGAIGYLIYTKKFKKTPQIPPVEPQPTDSSTTVPPATPAQLSGSSQ